MKSLCKVCQSTIECLSRANWLSTLLAPNLCDRRIVLHFCDSKNCRAIKNGLERVFDNEPLQQQLACV